MSKQLKRRLFFILDIVSSKDLPSRIFDIFIILMITLNVAAVTLETVPSVFYKYGRFFIWFDTFSVAVFTVEYLARVILCASYSQYSRPFFGRLKYMFSTMALIDLLAIAPYYIQLFFDCDLRVISLFRILRFFRILKLGRYSKSLRIIIRVFKLKSEELFISLCVMLILLTLSSTMMYLFERNAQPNVFSSIPASMWWGIITLTTVGYGDVYPVTLYGKIFGGIIAMIGFGLFALPAGIIASGFSEELQLRKQKHQVCPHCGKSISQK